MSFTVAEDDSTATEIHLPADVDWAMLDKSKFFVLGAALFSGVSAALYPAVLLKTRQQVSSTSQHNYNCSCLRLAFTILRQEGIVGLYKGFGTSLTGTVPARALYMTALEITKSKVGPAAVQFGVPEPAAATIANAAGGVSAAVAAQLVWTPVDVVSQRLMVQGEQGLKKYRGGVDAFRSILSNYGLSGLYRGFGMSILTYAPSNAVWWAAYSMTQRSVWEGLNLIQGREGVWRPETGTVMAVQGASAAVAGGIAAVITTPLDTIKTRLQVLDGEGGDKKVSVMQTARNLVKEGGWVACYRGLGPRWASMSMSATTMITTYEFLKRLSTKNQEKNLT